MMTLILVVFACKVVGLVALGRWLFRPGGAFDRLEMGR